MPESKPTNASSPISSTTPGSASSAAIEPSTLEPLLRCGAVCNNAEPATESTRHEYHGDPTEVALLVAAAKAGVEQLVRQLALEWGHHGIRANAIAPGPVEGTEGVRRLLPGEAVSFPLRCPAVAGEQ
jgi:magnesium-transporting ATPase (P-type)